MMDDLGFSKPAIEQAALGWLEVIVWRIVHLPDISPGGDTLSQRKREDFSEVMLASGCAMCSHD